MLECNRSFNEQPALKSGTSNIEIDSDSAKLVPEIHPAALNFYGLKQKDFSNEINVPSQNPEVQLNQSLQQEVVPSFEKSSKSNDDFAAELIPEKLVSSKGDGLASWRLIDRPKGDLALFSTSVGLVVMHGRAAHERVRFEEIEDSLKGQNKHQSQALLLPDNLELDQVDSVILSEQSSSLKNIGFEQRSLDETFFG